MVNTVSASTAADRLESSAQGISSRYESGVQNPRNAWQASTLNQSDAWSQGVQQAIQNDQFQTGVSNSSDEEWQSASLSLGTQRIASGLRDNIDDYQESVQPFLEALQQTDLPARGPAGDLDQNLQRVRAVDEALVEEKRRR
jgi:hypothetical protein